ncbi:MAG: MarR family transcriptional regulator [Deltaproteobacteria bacterium]|nr:MarR family transcriptional regulator [Deltaproteobacteria bacterium]
MAPREVSHISRHLVSVSSAVRTRISDGLRERGHRLTVSVSHLVPNLPAEGLGMSALAERAGLSIQRAGQLVQQLEDDGYLTRVPDARDGRARRVVYTRRGQKLLGDIEALQVEITEQLDEILGKQRTEQLLVDLAELDRELNRSESGVRVVTG